MLRGVNDQPAPPATDVEQPLTGLETELPANQIELCFLRDIERIIPRAEIRARINHPLVEPELIKGVADIVVELDRRGVAHRGVSRAELARVLRKAGVGEIVFRLPRKPDHETDQFRDRERRAQSSADRLTELGCCFHAAIDVDIAGDVGFDDRQLVRRQQHPAQRSGPVENQRERRIGIRAAIDGSVPESHVKRSVSGVAEQRDEHRATTRRCPVVEEESGCAELCLCGRHSIVEFTARR